MKILITGRAGSGKSAVAAGLRQRGFTAFDTDDVPGLSSWYDRHTGQAVQLTRTDLVDLERYRWAWNPEVLNQLIKSHADIFVCGGAENDFEFEDSFDRHFVLEVPPAVQIARLTSRTNNDYGRDPAMHANIIEQERRHVARAQELGATILHADRPVDAVIADLLRYMP